MARMGPMQIGRYNKHVNESYGPDNNIMKFYITEYSSRLGIDNFKPRYGQHVGTGYKSNFRPGVYYSRKLDELDNPIMGHIVRDNYHSITDKSYRGYTGCNGKEPLPSDVGISTNAYIKENHRTTPSYREAHSVFVSDPSRLKSKQPLLHSLRNKHPIDRENNSHGPKYFSTEHLTQFHQKPQHVDTSSKTVGPKEQSGFTCSKNLEPITYQPDDNHDGLYPGWCTGRPTGISMMKTGFLPHEHKNGTEKLQDVALKANRDNGFTRYIQPTAAHTASKGKVYTKLADIKNPQMLKKTRQSDPAEYINLAHPHAFPSMNQALHQGKQLHEPTLMDELGKVTIGEKEDSGFVHNNKSYMSPLHNLTKFQTQYKDHYYDKNHPIKTQYGKLNDESVMEQQEDGYTKSEKLHSFGKPFDTSKELCTLHPYVNRSLKARDPFYAEKIYEHKKIDLTTA